MTHKNVAFVKTNNNRLKLEQIDLDPTNAADQMALELLQENPQIFEEQVRYVLQKATVSSVTQ